MSFTFRVSILLAACAAVLAAAEIRGTVLDPSDAAIPNAQVSAVSRSGVVAQTITDSAGRFELKVADPANAHLLVTAPGFETKTWRSVPKRRYPFNLSLAAQSDSVRVVGSTIDVPVSEQGGSVSIIPAMKSASAMSLSLSIFCATCPAWR